MSKTISGFSKLSKSKKIEWLVNTHFSKKETARQILEQYWNSDTKLQQLHDEFIENTISNYYLPFGVAPNFLINDKLYTIPMAIEESSVVAAASKSAKFWLQRGGFKTMVLSTTKIGQVHFMYFGNYETLKSYFTYIKPKLIEDVKPITKNMENRGGGIMDIELRDKTKDIKGYFQLHVSFETLDAMGANFINSCLEQFAKTFKDNALLYETFSEEEKQIQIVMSILSNYVPDCLVRAEVSCKIEDLNEDDAISPDEFAAKFIQAVTIAEVEPYRAVTHNKGIMNGIDAVVLATGNDFRAVEAGVHAYASRNGTYSSLTHAKIEDGMFYFWMEIPLALGTVGGLTGLHPLVKLSLELLDNPSAKELMQIVAVAGLSQNFAALRSLTTTGIQKGHMKMHLMNILNQFQATDQEKAIIIDYFKTHTVSHNEVVNVLQNLRVKN
ncbi:MAG: hydroxymethylglutaryl-CoA reductase, degradative [Flavobacteriales bacterium]|nr:hydroxymethylglutaryl-CoA reductase, degradative [Flavobacteriia bacterium]NCP05724.1 hydroxymethylglutaryl-CoA reductase, degradative [Flavobacteriales bacterium]PIV92902.1 MAG: hydroxymethylglutaryl-CoA reductase, degradative [Flavobacteriaceae bacterium CG17_big_fil_post_rev_8_21_14_2_50_33_15]PIY12086.1 MAG: hydroxymethylglutaryl-CoA reductase, degradative [Flavobacteriaceae bacterium CG_4_10_14_3_um_filter_33_47]PJB19251.1 MAG: hydroxymethylglutaryl-CoA reductase, degradative [Flavobact